MTAARLRSELAVIGAEADDKGTYPRRGVELLAGDGLLAPMVQAEYGGRAMSHTQLAAWCAELGEIDTNARTLVTVQSMVAAAITRWGTDGQRRQWLPGLASGTVVAALAFSEADAGSDLSRVAATLTPASGAARWTLSGRKVWVSLGGCADVVLVLAGGAPGLTTVLCRADDPSVMRSSRVSSLGMRGSSLADLDFSATPLGADAVLGRAGLGLSTVAQTALDMGRLCVAAGCAGLIGAALAASLAHSRARVQFGKPLGEHQLIQRVLARLAVGHATADALTQRAARALDDGARDARRLVWMAKYHAAEVAERAARGAVEVHGSAGVEPTSPPARLLGEAALMRIIEGSAAVAEQVIAKLTRAGTEPGS